MTALITKQVLGAVLLASLLLIKNSDGYSSGAPVFVCESMVPNHGVGPQNSISPYSISTSQPQNDESVVHIIISSPEDDFSGFLVQGRTSPSVNKTIGSFVLVPEDAKTIDCGNVKASAATQKSNSRKRTMELVWQAPADYDGEVTFVATIVKQKSTFWVGLESPPVKVKREAGDGAGVVTVSPYNPELQKLLNAEASLYDGCGTRKNCVGFPPGCIELRNCSGAVSVIALNRGYQFDMFAKQSTYVSMGLSEDDKMGGDNVIDCIRDENSIKAVRSWNLPNNKKNRRDGVDQVGFSLVNGSYAEGLLACRFIHDPVNVIHNVTFDLDKNEYYLFVAAGTEVRPTHVYYHDVGRALSPEAKKLSDLSKPVKDPFYNDCGVLKNCFGFPDGCIEGQSCRGIVSVLVEGDKYTFELKGETSGYIAAALSEDQSMGKDSVMECVYDPNTPSNPVKLFMSYNLPNQKANTRQRVPQSVVTLLSSTYEDGKIYCKFTRDTRTIVEGTTYNLATDQYYLLLASGSSIRSDGVDYHDLFSVASGASKALSDVGANKAASKLLIYVHGGCMITAWIGLASLGIVFARYYKQTWVGSQICGKDIWFTWHRFFMFLTWVLSIAGWFSIFFYLDHFVEGEARTHGILGVVTLVLCFIQPFMAAFRPAPGSRNRPLFNWIHWLVGNGAHIVGIVTIFLAVQLKKAKLPQWMDWILVGYVAYYVIIHLVLSLSNCLSERQGASRVNAFPMKDMHNSRNPLNSMERKRDSTYSGFRKFLLFIHFILIIGVSAVLVSLVVFSPIDSYWKTVMSKINSM